MILIAENVLSSELLYGGDFLQTVEVDVVGVSEDDVTVWLGGDVLFLKVCYVREGEGG